MAWQDALPLAVTRIDAEQERELRLAAQARAGADWALAALIARYQPAVTRYLTRLTGNAELAHTLAERIFLRMERRLHGPQGGHQLRLWLLRACTEAGLEAVCQPRRTAPAQLEGPHLRGLLTGRVSDGATNRLRAGWDAVAEMTGTTRRQVRKLIWSRPPADLQVTSEPSDQPPSPAADEEFFSEQDAGTALRFRLIRAVLAELPYGDAQCLALHLVAGLNQAEVAKALGITQSATRRRIVHGLQLFSQRYEAAAASLGLPPEVTLGQSTSVPAQLQPADNVVAAMAEVPALAETPELGARSSPSQPIWDGVYAEAGQGLDLRMASARLIVDAVPATAAATAVDPVVIDAAPFVVLPTAQDWLVVAEPETNIDTPDVLLDMERIQAMVPATQTPTTAITVPPHVGEARFVPVLSPPAEPSSLSAAEVTFPPLDAFASGTLTAYPLAIPRLVPVLSPAEESEFTDLTLRAVVVDAKLGGFGAPSAPTVPLPGRGPRRTTAFIITTPDEDQPSVTE
jgi:RNA polymerase sigma factor (sigma-70 family)